MITRKEFPSYGALIGFGETTLPEFFRRPGAGVYSHNHHMYGDIKNWFISAVAGLRYNPTRTDHRHVLVKPAFLRALTFAEASYISPFGELFVRWERTEDEIRLRVCTPNGITAEIVLPDGTQIVHTGDHVYHILLQNNRHICMRAKPTRPPVTAKVIDGFSSSVGSVILIIYSRQKRQ